ncbi:MAG: FAD-dependent oxidoreductase, partial [Candidatus Binatia bacterium]
LSLSARLSYGKTASRATAIVSREEIMKPYDIVTVGGGLGGSVLARAMAERGARVLVIERETHFKDRVRGEALAPWGVAEAKQLGVYDLLRDGGGHMIRTMRLFVGGTQVVERDFAATTPQKCGWLTYYHPKVQDILIQSAESAGAEVRRGAHVRAVRPGSPPVVTVTHGDQTEEISARLVVGADGRSSRVRQWAGFTVTNDPAKLLFCGVLLEDVPVEPDFYQFSAPHIGQIGFIFPQQDRRARTYFGFHKDNELQRLQGTHDLARFKQHAVAIGFPAEILEAAKPAGPLATFDGADSWVRHPYKEGVALVGDAASTSDPTWGQGMSLTLRDARVLRDCLLAENDWDKAGHAYAEEHDRYYGVQHEADGWYQELFMQPGAEADARRERALPLIVGDPARMVDCPHSGPEAPHDEQARKRLFGED